MYSDASASRRRIRRGPIVGAALIAGALIVSPSAATASRPCDEPGNPCSSGPVSAPGTVDVNDGFTLTVRHAPRSGAKKVRELPDGKRVRIVCQTQGEQVTGTFGTSTLWDKLKHGGYVSDTFIFTGTDGRVAPECPPRVKPNPTPQPQPVEQQSGRPRSVTLRNDYPYASASPEAADPWGFYFRECTSFVAFRLNQLKHFKFTNYMANGHFGDAGHWDDNARALGFTVNKRPTVGAVMVRDSGTWGHVAIVSKVKPNKFLVEEYNHDVSHGYGKRWLSRSRTSGDWDHFIHFRT